MQDLEVYVNVQFHYISTYSPIPVLVGKKCIMSRLLHEIISPSAANHTRICFICPVIVQCVPYVRIKYVY